MINCPPLSLAFPRVRLIVIVCGALGLGIASPIVAGVNEWTSIGPEGGVVNSIAIHPQNPSVLYAATAAGGVFKSLDGGTSWIAANKGLAVGVTPANTRLNVLAIAIEPSRPSTLYISLAGIGLYRSINAAATWAPLQLNRLFGADPGISALATDQGNVYAGGYVSRDFGQTWTKAITTQFGRQALALDPRTRGVGYLATPLQGVSRLSDFEHWTPPQLLGGEGVLSVTTDSFYSYAATPSGVIFLSRDKGGSWSRAGALPAGSGVTGIATHNASGRLFVSTLTGPYVSDDVGKTFTPLGRISDDAAVSEIALVSTNLLTLYAATASGISRSLDGGQTWSRANSGLTALTSKRILIDTRIPSAIWTGVDESVGRSVQAAPRVFRSLDRGQTWTSAILHGGGAFVGLAIDATAPNILYAAVSNAVFRSDDGGQSWSPTASPGFGRSSAVTTLVADPSSGGRLYAGTEEGLAGGDFWISADGGRTWTMDTPSLGRVLAIAVSVGAPGTVFVSSSQGGILKSVDSGLTFTKAGDSPFSPFPSASLAVDPRDPATLYVAGSQGTGRGVHRSNDGGSTWGAIDAGPGSPGGLIETDVRSGAVLLGGFGAVARSTDRGDTWLTLSHGLEPRWVLDAVVSPWDPTVLIASSDGLGLFENTLSRPSSQCVQDPTTLCLHGSRFEARVDFDSVAAHASPVGFDTGAFWLFSGGNLELLIKVVDGRRVNGHFWVFSGGLSDIAYTLTIRDVETGSTRSYENRQGEMRSVADTSAFLATEDPSEVTPPPETTPAIEGGSGCVISFANLCLAERRFSVEVAVPDPSGVPGVPGVPLLGVAVPLTSEAGSFWVFTPNNLEIIVKVVDGRAVNGHFWIFIGGLSDLEYRVRVIDNLSLKLKDYVNTPGVVASVADTSTF